MILFYSLKTLTSVAKVDLNVLLSYTHPFWHWTANVSSLLFQPDKCWYWGFENIWQELGIPSLSAGIPTASFCSRVKFPKMPPSSRVEMLQWWGGTAAMKLFSRKWHGKVIRDMIWIKTSLSWNFPNPLISERILSNFILLCCWIVTKLNVVTVKWSWMMNTVAHNVNYYPHKFFFQHFIGVCEFMNNKYSSTFYHRPHMPGN